MKLETDFNWFLGNFGLLPIETQNKYLNIVESLIKKYVSYEACHEAYFILTTNKSLFVGQPGIPAHEGVYRFKTDVDVNGKYYLDMMTVLLKFRS